MAARDVSVIGPLNIDLIISGEGPPNWEATPTWDGPAAMELTAAGSVGYTVQNLARLGLSVAVCSCLPDDPLGGFVADTLRRAGVDTGLVRQIPDTVIGIGAYMLLFGSRKRPLAYRLPTHDFWPYHLRDDERAALLDARLLHCGGYLHAQAAWHGDLVGLFREARQRGLLTALDPQFPLWAMQPPWLPVLDDLLPHVAILFCDDGEARSLTGRETLDDCGAHLLDTGPETVIIKRGDQGSRVYQRGADPIAQAAITLGPFVDSIGAGDTFDAGYLYGRLNGWPADECALFAAIAAGFTVTASGGSAAMPGVERVLEQMDRWRGRG